MGYFSILVFSKISIQYNNPVIFIEPGINAFSILTEDIDRLVETLKTDGLTILEVNKLDGPEAYV